MAEGGRALFFFDGAVLFGIVVGRQIHIGKAQLQRARIFAARIAGDGVFFCVAFKLSRIIPSGVSGIFSIADNTFTPLSRNAFLCIAVSYLFRKNRSNL